MSSLEIGLRSSFLARYSRRGWGWEIGPSASLAKWHSSHQAERGEGQAQGPITAASVSPRKKAPTPGLRDLQCYYVTEKRDQFGQRPKLPCTRRSIHPPRLPPQAGLTVTLIHGFTCRRPPHHEQLSTTRLRERHMPPQIGFCLYFRSSIGRAFKLQCLLLPPPHIKVAPIGRSLAYPSLEIYVLRLPTPGELSYLQLRISGSHFCRCLPKRRVLISIQRTVNKQGRAEDRFYYLRIIENAVDNFMASAFLYGCNLEGFRCLLLYSSGRRVG